MKPVPVIVTVVGTPSRIAFGAPVVGDGDEGSSDRVESRDQCASTTIGVRHESRVSDRVVAVAGTVTVP